MEILQIAILIYKYFIGLLIIISISKIFLEVVEREHKKRIKHIKQYRNRKQNN